MERQASIDALVSSLNARAPELTAKGIAMMTYNPSIGRVLEERGVDKFAVMAWEEVQRLGAIGTMDAFDSFHDAFVRWVQDTLKTNKGEKLSYGQAQKPVNVFLKVYVAHANLPTQDVATTLRPFLHVPLDRVVMKYFYKHFPHEYHEFLDPMIEQYRAAAAQHPGGRVTLPDRVFLNLRSIFGKDHYYAWQGLFRFLCPGGPVVLDFVWSLERRLASPVSKD